MAARRRPSTRLQEQLRVFAEQLWSRVAECTSRDHDGDGEPEGCGLTRVAAAGGGAEWAPLRENMVEAILPVGSNRGVGCDMVPVELLECSPPSSARILESLFANNLSPDTASACVDGAVRRSRSQRPKAQWRKRGVGLINHTGNFFKGLAEASQSSVGGSGFPLSGGTSEECGPSISFVEGLVASAGSQRQVSMRLVC